MTRFANKFVLSWWAMAILIVLAIIIAVALAGGIGIPLLAALCFCLCIFVFFLWEGATVLAFAFGFVDSVFPWAIPAAMLGHAVDKPGIATLFTGLLLILVVRLFAVKMFGWIFTTIRGLNPFSENSIQGQLIQITAKQTMGWELTFQSEKDLRKVPPLRLLLVKLVLIAAFFTIGAEVLLLLEPVLVGPIRLLVGVLMLTVAIVTLVLAELPGFAGAMYPDQRKWETVERIEDNLNWALGRILLPLSVVLIILLFGVNVALWGFRNVVGDQFYYDTVGVMNEDGQVETPGYLRTKAKEEIVKTLHPTERRRVRRAHTAAAPEVEATGRTAEILEELEALKSQ